MAESPADMSYVVVEGEWRGASIVDDDGQMVLQFTRHGRISTEEHVRLLDATRSLLREIVARLNSEEVSRGGA